MSILLDFLIGMALLYLLIAVVSSFVLEIGTSYFNLRGKRLKQLIAQLIANDPDGKNGKWLRDFYNHPQIQALHLPSFQTGTGSPPSYIPAQRYASSVIDLLHKAAGLAPGDALKMQAIREALIAAHRAKGLETLMLGVLQATSDQDKKTPFNPGASEDAYLAAVGTITSRLGLTSNGNLTEPALRDALSNLEFASTLPKELDAFLKSILADGPKTIDEVKHQVTDAFLLLKEVAKAHTAEDARDPAKLKEQLATRQPGYLPEGLRATLASALANGADSVEAIQKALVDGFDATMERASGWYKRFAQLCLMAIAFGLAFLFNLDSLYVGERLLHDPQLRGIAVQSATQIAPPDGSATLSDLERHVRNRLALPAGDVNAALEQSAMAMDVKATPTARQAAVEQLRKTAGILLASTHFNPIDAAADRAFLLETTDAARAFALVDDPRLAPTPPEACPLKPSAPKPEAGASEWITYIRCPNGQVDRSADIKAFQASEALCIAPTRIIDADLCKLLLPIVRATPNPDSAAISKLNSQLQLMKNRQDTLDKQLDSALARLPKIGWWLDDIPGTNPGLLAIVGWIITALMAGFGAPLWFELLSKLVNLRSVGIKPEEAAQKKAAKPDGK